MTNKLTSLIADIRFLFLVGLVIAMMVAVVPALSRAATFAFVNQAGDVSTVVADTANIALMTALNIDEHSGVLLLNTSSDFDIVGDRVPVN